jgi:hypothetical protein
MYEFSDYKQNHLEYWIWNIGIDLGFEIWDVRFELLNFLSFSSV